MTAHAGAPTSYAYQWQHDASGSSALPEASTSPLERAQWDLDRAVEVRDETASLLREKERAVGTARDKLDEAKRQAAAAIPVDRTAIQLSGGGAVTPEHDEINPANGQQRGYVVLSPAEREKGFVRPYRDAYRHQTCGKITTMSRDIAETYARDPVFYGGTFCSTCQGHFPIGEAGEFTWYEMDGREGPKVGT